MSDRSEQSEQDYEADELVDEYALSPHEADRLLNQFGSDRKEIDFLLSHRPIAPCPTSRYPKTDDDQHDFLFEI